MINKIKIIIEIDISIKRIPDIIIEPKQQTKNENKHRILKITMS